MRVEVQIGTIEVDSLPQGMSAERLRVAVPEALEALIRAGGVSGTPVSGSRGSEYSRTAFGATGLSAKVAVAIYDGVWR